MEYIERKAVINSITKIISKSDMPEDWSKGMIAAMSTLYRIPAADVRPVVTCTDCKYNEREVTDLLGNNAIQCITGLTHRHDWFCADGKKREES